MAAWDYYENEFIVIASFLGQVSCSFITTKYFLSVRKFTELLIKRFGSAPKSNSWRKKLFKINEITRRATPYPLADIF